MKLFKYVLTGYLLLLQRKHNMKVEMEMEIQMLKKMVQSQLVAVNYLL